MKSQPGIPNEGDRVKIVEIHRSDSYYGKKRLVGLIGIALGIYKEESVKSGWVGFDFKYPERHVFYQVRVKILKRAKSKKQ